MTPPVSGGGRDGDHRGGDGGDRGEDNGDRGEDNGAGLPAERRGPGRRPNPLPPGGGPRIQLARELRALKGSRTNKDIADHAYVHVTTVSRALDGLHVASAELVNAFCELSDGDAERLLRLRAQAEREPRTDAEVAAAQVAEEAEEAEAERDAAAAVREDTEGGVNRDEVTADGRTTEEDARKPEASDGGGNGGGNGDVGERGADAGAAGGAHGGAAGGGAAGGGAAGGSAPGGGAAGGGRSAEGDGRPRWRVVLVAAVAAVIAVVLVVAAVVVARVVQAAPQRPQPPAPAPAPVASSLAPGRCGRSAVFVSLGGPLECVGRITDTELAAMPAALQPVLGQIAGENEKVAKDVADPGVPAGGGTGPVPGAPAVTIAYLLPISPGSGAAASVSTAQYAAELDGVLRAQQRADDTPTLGDLPKIRVAVYNIGTDGLGWVHVINDLEAQMHDPAAPTVAAAGLGPGLDSTGAAAETLTRLGISVLPSRAIADQLTALRTDPPGLLRPTPISAQLAAAAAAEMRTSGDRSVQVVQDIRADNLDAASLAANFSTALQSDQNSTAPRATPSAITYDSSLLPAGTAFRNELRTRCAPSPSGTPTGPDAFFVAGRGSQVGEFLEALAASPCRGPVSVVAGPDGAEVLQQLRLAHENPQDPAGAQLTAAFASGKFQFRYAALAHPALWNTASFNQNYNDTIASFTDLRADPRLQQGDQLLGYDAALTAISCARGAVTSQYAPTPTPQAVASACSATTTANPVYGAAGPIGFDPTGHTSATVVPIVEVRPDTTAPMVMTDP